MGMIDLAVNQAAVIGAMLVKPECIGSALPQLRGEDFVYDSYRRLFYAIRKLFSEEKPIDPVTVLDEVKISPGQDWYQLIQDAMLTGTAANLDAYIPLLRNDAKLARVREAATSLEGIQDLDTAREALQHLLGDLGDKPGVKIVTMNQGLQDFLQRQKTQEKYLSWGFRALDELLFIGRGKFVILGGYASHGKTALALSMAMHQAKDHRVGFYSLETDDGTLHDRLISSVAKISMGRIKRRELTQEDYDTVAAVSQRYVSSKLDIVLAAGCSVDEIFALAQSRRHEIIYVDYLQLIPGRGKNRTEIVTDVSLAIKSKLQATGITMVGLSQLSRPDKVGKVQQAPRMSDLRESGQLEQDADAILMLYKERPDDPASRRVLTIEKNKEGEVRQMFLSFDGDVQTFALHRNQTPAKKERKEAEYHQTTFSELPDPDPDCPY